MAHQTYHGVFLPDGKGEPVALFKDGDLAQAHRLQLPNGAAGIVVETDGWGKRDDVAAMFPAAEPVPAMSVADEMRKAAIKQQLTEEERDKRLTEDVKREMADEKQAAAKAEREDGDDHPTAKETPAQEVELREPASSTATAPASTNVTTPRGRRE